MNIHSTVQIWLLAGLLVLHLPVISAESGAAAEKQSINESKDTVQIKNQTASGRDGLIRPVYVPPRRGAPLTRVGGGTRGGVGGQPFVTVIAPEHSGLSGDQQPRLYWYLSKESRTRFEFDLINDRETEPILEVTSDRNMPPGFNYIDLAEHGITLERGISYQWSVALVQDSDQRSTDIVSSGRVEYVEPSAGLQAQLGVADQVDAVRILAGQGYWYDAFSRLSELIAANPANSELLEWRASLLEQVGLANLDGGGVARSVDGGGE